jgi:hypothetical protein
MPKMRHPQSKQTIDVAPAQVAMYESQGWRKVAAAKKTSARTSTPANTATTKE